VEYACTCRCYHVHAQNACPVQVSKLPMLCTCAQVHVMNTRRASTANPCWCYAGTFTSTHALTRAHHAHARTRARTGPLSPAWQTLAAEMSCSPCCPHGRGCQPPCAVGVGQCPKACRCCCCAASVAGVPRV